jgi:pimeloyl-ACP methyl ester carboxylesterase
VIRASYTEVGGTLSYVEQCGSGPSVLCVHTAGQSGVQWRYTIEPLAALGYHVVVPDLPGHGRSEPAPDGPVEDLAHYTDWCEELIEHLGLDRPYAVGCSIGGKIVLDLATRLGDRLSGAVVLAADAGMGKVGLSGLYRELEDVAAPSRSDRTHLGTLAVVGSTLPAKRAELIATMHRREDPVVSTSDLIGWGTHDVRAELEAVECPVHLVAGEDDLWLDAAKVRRTAERLPGARFTLLPGIGHYPMEELDSFAATLDWWLRELRELREGA